MTVVTLIDGKAVPNGTSTAPATTIHGQVNWQAQIDGISPVSVEFRIDADTAHKQGIAGVWVEHQRPYQWKGDPDGRLDTTLLSDGIHKLGVRSLDANGKQIPGGQQATWVKVDNKVPPPPPAPLTVTSSLVGASALTGPVEWSAVPSGPVTAVDFMIDGQVRWTEHVSPFVFNGDGSKLDPAVLTNGSHLFTVVATSADGTKATASVTLAVDVALPPPPPPPSGGSEGNLGFWMYATSQTDYLFTNGRPTQADKDFEVAHWDLVECWLDVVSTYHDGAMRYDDMLQIYVGSSVAAQHPDWILKNSAGGNMIYNTHYMADIGNQAYQDFKAQECANLVGVKGAKGVKLDDMNTIGPSVQGAIDPRTGAAMTTENWQKYYVQLATKIKAKVKAAGAKLVAHNSLWWGGGVDFDNAWKLADLYQFERGFNDPNYSASTILRLFAFIDKIHSFGVGAIHLSYASTKQGVDFNVACALLCSNGHDYVYGIGWKPEAWDPVYDLDLGAAQGPRYLISGTLYRRNFARGYVTADLTTKVGQLVKTA